MDVPSQLRAVIRSLRLAQGLTQAAVGKKMGVSLKRISGIERHPERVSVDQITLLVAALGGHLVVVVDEKRKKKKTDW